jgi:hypothetical protein
VFLDYGELKNAPYWREHRVARTATITTTDELKEVHEILPERIRIKF